ncbi:MAG: transcription-repair coupling factor [Gammaproteobacteria bacterium]|nr:transcription-repair coupling factor [Gammaproteobacteria bacterium]
MYPKDALPLPDAAHPLRQWPRGSVSAQALALAQAAARDSRPWVVVAPDARTLDQLQRALGFFVDGDAPILHLPDWEVLPYEQFSPLPDLVSDRLATLAQLPRLQKGLLLVSAETLLQRLPPTDYIEGRAFDLAEGQSFSMRAVSEQLVRAGYQMVAQVGAPGEFALRGSLFDVFPMGYAQPLRIDLFDENIDSIRHFDPDTQRSLERLPKLRLLPAREIPLDEDSCREFRRRYRTRFEGDPTRSTVYRGLRQNIGPAGIEFYLPLFFEGTATLFDYLPRDPVLVLPEHLDSRLGQVWQEIAARYEDQRHDIEHPVLEPAELFLSPEEAMVRIGQRARVEWSAESPAAVQGAPEIKLDTRAAQPLEPLVRYLDSYPGRVLLAADSPGRREVLHDLLRGAGLAHDQVGGWRDFLKSKARLCLAIGADVGGLSLQAPDITLLADGELFGRHAQQERRRRRSQLDPAAILRDLQDLSAGAPVVHTEYGVGRYVGLQPMQVAGEDGEFLVIEYAGGDRIYVPVSALHNVNRYTGASPEAAPLHKLGSEQWAKARRRASEQVRDVAAELLDLYARRQARKGSALTGDEAEYRAFAAAFPFEETADQAEAITAVLRDMASERPMDRVVCGDVGFGKTEVAMRAAFVAVQAGRQVVVLVPTTLLAEQHAGNFRDRFADLPVRIESLSRFRSATASKDILAQLADGRIDILVATHRLLHADARFRNLGLIIVDEEHRFGVRDKERLKALRAEVHVLTLTATPIPRTLNMALGGLRELSLITTPPAGRVAIRTSVAEWHAPTIREAMLRELRRGGQIYFVHNEIQGIEKIAEDLRRIVPEATLRVGHGQMRERDLEQLMVDFYHRRFDVLLCTTIIESGIDVPTANTIIINQADRLGLAQLHQLRGRVGRSHHRAFAYLLVASRKALTQDAQRRLEAIESLEELGAGFVLATHDLEIRGAGEFLGESQSGELTEVGLALYLDMLESAVRSLKSGGDGAVGAPLAGSAEVNLHLPALLPSDYVADVQMRLGLYKRIAAAPDAQGLDDLQAEIGDRFGALPPAATQLFHNARLTQQCRALGLRRLDVSTQSSYLVFEEKNAIDPGAVIKLLQKEPRVYRLEGPLKLRIARGAEPAARFEFAQRLLAGLR